MDESQHPPGLPEKPKSFPDAATCKVRAVTGMEGVYECLSLWGASCPYMIFFERKRFCRHEGAAGLVPQAPNSPAGT